MAMVQNMAYIVAIADCCELDIWDNPLGITVSQTPESAIMSMSTHSDGLTLLGDELAFSAGRFKLPRDRAEVHRPTTLLDSRAFWDLPISG